MCGIVAVARQPSRRRVPEPQQIIEPLEEAQRRCPEEGRSEGLAAALRATVEPIRQADRLLRGVPGVICLLSSSQSSATIEQQLTSISGRVKSVEEALDRGSVPAEDLEEVNAALVDLKDAVWAVRSDRLGTARGVAELAGADAGPAAIEAFTSIHVALSAIDRLEVRGRDSAGLHVLIRQHHLELDSPSIRSLLSGRMDDPLFRGSAVRVADGHLSFVYKAAAEIGELGDNTSAIRAQIREDVLLRRALESPDSRALVIGHTRWASVGMISEANAHPLNSEETGGNRGPYCVAALNGDVDNYADLKAAHDLELHDEITTDAKVIPVLVSRRLAQGLGPSAAFRETVGSFDGSVAIVAASAAAPDTLLCALRGSGQALYLGLSEDAYIVASEPYGLVEQCDRYLRMDGESPARPGDASSRGQIVVVSDEAGGDPGGLRRTSYDGTELPVSTEEFVRPQITTRDIDRGPHPHFLLKEIHESPQSFRKTLRGKLVEQDGGLDVVVGEETIPPAIAERLRKGLITRAFVIGQGTAAVAGHAVAAALVQLVGTGGLTVEATAATELSGFSMRDDMADTLVIAVSQSGTTTDTNRTVEIARSHGAAVISIVNRRNSDLCDRSDGVLYTSDGRDVEMAVPSTKAFYSQIAAGYLLAFAIAGHLGVDVDGRDVLGALRDLPAAMEAVLELRPQIAEIARRHAPYRRHWAVVGSGVNRVAAEEVRIKLSELCYKSISCDVTEDKKHIDLAAEPLIVVCAAGIYGSNAEDLAKEIAIYRAHKAAPIVICSEGEELFHAAVDVIRVLAVHPSVDHVLSAMAGHLFGYEAALAIDDQARLLRSARQVIEEAATASANGLSEHLAAGLRPVAQRFHEELREGAFNGHLAPSTAVRLASLFRYAAGWAPLDLYPVEHGKIGTPGVVADDLAEALTAGIDELTRPIDAIRHQAKTVTVGISRADDTLLRVPLVRSVLEAGVARDRLSYRTLRALAALDPAVEQVTGYTHYRIEGDVVAEATIHVTDKGGIARDIPSRTDREPRLRGTKHRVASEREVLVTLGRADDRPLIIVPELKGTDVTGLALLHVRFHDRLPAPVMRSVLEGYRDRYAALRDLVTETEPAFRDDLLAGMDVSKLLVDSVQLLADRWRTNGR